MTPLGNSPRRQGGRSRVYGTENSLDLDHPRDDAAGLLELPYQLIRKKK
jgi:hypothetical protein